ncbi:HET-domain-containing protein, partial [Polyplosphaeria fusca]
IDIDRLRRWIRTCRESHGTPHRKSYFHSPVHPTEIPGFKVINVHQECLSRLEADNDYLTLSYVWGGKNDVLTTKARLDGFSTEGAFKQVVLPKTIRDAIDLTKELGYTYLWIDSLCIVQDDAVEKPGLIASMGAIYANSILTIVAATSANAESGLSGYRNASRQSGKPVHESIAPDLQLGVLPHFAVEYMDCFHATRGWT